MMYQSEYSEFDTDFLAALAAQVNATFDGKWSKEQVGEMLQLINSSYDEQALAAEPLPVGAVVVEGPVVETVETVEMPEPEPMPAIRTVEEPVLAAALDNFPEPAADNGTKRRGRPPGSRNKPRLEAAMTVLKDDVDGHLARLPVNETKELARKVTSSNTPADMVAIALKLAAAIAEAAAASGDEFPSVLEHSFGIVENLF